MHYYIYFVKNRLWKRISLIQKACVSLTHAHSHPSRIIPLTNENPKPQSRKGSKAEAPHPTPSSWAPTTTNSNQSKPHSLSPLQTTLLRGSVEKVFEKGENLIEIDEELILSIKKLQEIQDELEKEDVIRAMRSIKALLVPNETRLGSRCALCSLSFAVSDFSISISGENYHLLIVGPISSFN